eukprot:352764-Chlamydomonas_euryale.AAC.6
MQLQAFSCSCSTLLDLHDRCCRFKPGALRAPAARLVVATRTSRCRSLFPASSFRPKTEQCAGRPTSRGRPTTVGGTGYHLGSAGGRRYPHMCTRGVRRLRQAYREPTTVCGLRAADTDAAGLRRDTGGPVAAAATAVLQLQLASSAVDAAAAASRSTPDAHPPCCELRSRCARCLSVPQSRPWMLRLRSAARALIGGAPCPPPSPLDMQGRPLGGTCPAGRRWPTGLGACALGERSRVRRSISPLPAAPSPLLHSGQVPVSFACLCLCNSAVLCTTLQERAMIRTLSADCPRI